MKSPALKLRIFLVGSEFFHSWGGIQFVNRLLLSAFREMARHTPIEVECFSYGDAASEFVPEARFDALRGWHAARRRRAFLAARLAARLVASRPHVVLFTHVNLLRLARIVRSLAPGARVGVLGHGVEVWERLPSALLRPLQRADGVAAPSRYTRDRLVRVNGVDPGKTAVLAHGIDLEWRKVHDANRPHPSPARVLLSVTRMNVADAYKGIDTVIRAMPEVLRRCPGARYVIAGEGDDRPRLERLAAETGVAGPVEFRGELQDGELSAAYRDAQIFVLPSRKEGFGIVFLEAMYHRLPVVAAAAGGSVDVVVNEETGLLVPPDNPSALSAALVRLLEAPVDCERLGAAGRRRLETHFQLEHFTARWEEWLARLAPEAFYLARHSRVFAAQNLATEAAN